MKNIQQRISDAKQLGNFAETYEKSNPLLAKTLYVISGAMADGDFGTIAVMMGHYARLKMRGEKA